MVSVAGRTYQLPSNHSPNPEYRESSIEYQVSSIEHPPVSAPKVVVKKPAQNRSKSDYFLQKNAKNRSFLTKKCKKMLIFTLIFSLKTNKSYKITLFTTTNRPNFQNFRQKPYFLDFLSFFLLFFIFILSILASVAGN